MIDNNIVQNLHNGNATGAKSAQGIQLYTDWGTGRVISNVTISNNTISNIMSNAGGAYGIQTVDDITGVQILNNSITGADGAWEVGIAIDAHSGSTLTDTGVTLTGNKISNLTDGTGILAEATTLGSEIEVHHNDVFGNLAGIFNKGTQQIDALNNWWGSYTGPQDSISGDGSEPETNPAGTGNAVVGNVKYGEWENGSGTLTIKKLVCSDGVATSTTSFQPTSSSSAITESKLHPTQNGTVPINNTQTPITDLNESSYPGCEPAANFNFKVSAHPDDTQGGQSPTGPVIPVGTFTTDTDGIATISGLIDTGRLEVSEVDENGDALSDDRILSFGCYRNGQGHGNITNSGEYATFNSNKEAFCLAINKPNTRTISGTKFNDIDGDTTKDEFEQGLEGWTIKATEATPAASVTVDSSEVAGSDSVLLPAGQYLFIAEGTWHNAGGTYRHNDAEFRTTNDWSTWIDGPNGDLMVDSEFVEWGPYSSDHQYYLNYTLDTEQTVNFSVFDGSGTTKNPGWYGDNTGELTVRIYSVLDETVTTSDGSYSLTVPTNISEVRVYELQQDGWYQTTPTAPNYHELTFEGYEDVTDVDFGNRTTAYLSDVTVCKLDQNEEPVSGWTVGLATAEGDDQTVPVDGSAINSRVLPAGDVIVFANGTYRYGNSQMIADAGFAYRTTNIPPYPSTPQWVSGELLGTVGALEIKLNGANVSWMPYAPSHAYTYLAPGFAGGSIAAGNIYDSNYGDNVNNDNLRVRFESVYSSAETGEEGCVTFSDVPYGQYTPFEIMQPDWEFDSVSMDGDVYTTQPERLLVDETTEEVTYTNTFIGEEEEPEATPTPEPSPTATPSATPTPTPQVLGTSTSSSSSSSSSSSGGGSVKAPVCTAAVPVGAPNLTVTQTSPNTVSLSWTGVEPTTHYALFFTRSDGELYGASNIGKTTTYTVTNLSPGFSYDFQVLGVNDCAPGDRSNTASSAQITGGIVEGRPIGDGGQVLGVDTEESSEEQSEESTNETSETETAGTVLGASEELCATSWFQYLPLIMLVVLGVIVLVLEVVIRRDISRKLIPIAIVTIMTLVLFYWLRDCNCTTEAFTGLIDILCTWFWLVAAFEVLLLRAIGYAFIDDAN